MGEVLFEEELLEVLLVLDLRVSEHLEPLGVDAVVGDELLLVVYFALLFVATLEVDCDAEQLEDGGLINLLLWEVVSDAEQDLEGLLAYLQFVVPVERLGEEVEQLVMSAFDEEGEVLLVDELEEVQEHVEDLRDVQGGRVAEPPHRLL